MTTESENEKLKRQIKYLTELISGSTRSSTYRPQNDAPFSYSRLSTQYRNAHREDKTHSSSSKPCQYSKKGDRETQFSWKKYNVNVTKKNQNITQNASNLSSFKNVTGKVSTTTQHISLSKQLAPAASKPKTNDSDEQKLVFGKKESKTESVRVKEKIRHVKDDKTKNLHIVGDKSSLCNENSVVEKGKSDIKGVSERLRNHPFMNRTRNILQQKDCSKEAPPFKENEKFKLNQITPSSVNKGQDIIQTHKEGTTRDIPEKVMVGNMHESKLQTSTTSETFGSTCSKSNHSKTKPSLSSSKTEMIEELNRKLSEASIKIGELKKTLSLKKKLQEVNQSGQQSKIGKVCSRSGVPKIRKNSGAISDNDKKFNQSLSTSSGINIEPSLKNQLQSASSKISIGQSFRNQPPTGKTHLSGIETGSSFSNQAQPSDPTLYGNPTVTSFKGKEHNNESDPKFKVVKSKYSFKKIPSSSPAIDNIAPSSNNAPFTDTAPSPTMSRQKIISTRFKFQKTSIPVVNKNPVGMSRTMIASKIIKSKYKLKRVSLGSQQRRPMKTVLNTKFKLKKVPSQSGPLYGSYSKGLYHASTFPRYGTYKSQLSRKTHYWKSFTGRSYNLADSRNLYFNKYLTSYRNRPKCSYQGYHSFRGKRLLTSWNVNRRYILNHLQVSKNKVLSTRDSKQHSKSSTENVKLVVINGMLYKSSGHSLVKTGQSGPKQAPVVVKKMNASGMKIVKVRGVKFQMDSSGKTLRKIDSTSPTKAGKSPPPRTSQVNRVDIGGVTYIQTKPGTLEQFGSSQVKVIASRVKNRSIITAAAKYKKDNTKKKVTKKYCMFYNRFGKCQRGDNCPYHHDPDRVAVCTRFLRGTCKVTDCPFSHKVSKEKMPACSYFLRGVCNKEDCPYPHVNVGKAAKVCQEFVKGFCSMGEMCTKRHTLYCPSYTRTGVCAEDKPCKLKHMRKKPRHSPDKQAENNKMDKTKQNLKRKHDSEDDSGIPFKERKLPAYISIASDEIVNQQTGNDGLPKPAMKIKPKLK